MTIAPVRMPATPAPEPVHWPPADAPSSRVRRMLGGEQCTRRDVVIAVAELEGLYVRTRDRLVWLETTEDLHRQGLLAELDRKTAEVRALRARLAELGESGWTQ
jgi:hypothetical protein